MASSGQVAWLKYFKFNGNIETVMKKDSSVYDMSVITKKNRNYKSWHESSISFFKDL